MSLYSSESISDKFAFGSSFLSFSFLSSDSFLRDGPLLDFGGKRPAAFSYASARFETLACFLNNISVRKVSPESSTLAPLLLCELGRLLFDLDDTSETESSISSFY